MKRVILQFNFQSGMSASSVKGGGALGKGVEMLSGSIYRNMILFAIPLIATGVLQQSFNAVDIAMVGRFVGREALAAVGSNAMVINIMVNLFAGLAVGANVVAANYFGRQDQEGVSRVSATAFVVSLASGVILTLLGLVFTEPILIAMATPADVLPLASLYLKIIFAGMPMMMVFNFGAALLRSRGETKGPFYMLLVAGVLNTALNLLLIIVFEMGVAGVAIATIVSQALAAALMVRALRREQSPLKISFHKLRIHGVALRKMMRIGFPAGLQGMVFSFANIFVQTAVNSFGSEGVAGSAAALNFEYYSYFVVSAFVQATLAFTGQCYGAADYGRCRRIFRAGMLLAAVGCGALNIACVLLKGPLVRLFSDDALIFPYAYDRMEVVLLFQFIACSYEIAAGSMRGLGVSLTPALITIGGTCVLRLGWIFWVFPSLGSFRSLMAVYPLSWAVTGIGMLIAWRIVARRTLPQTTVK